MRRIRWILVSLAAVCLSGWSARAYAQQGLPPEVLAVYDEINDTDKLRVLNPLNLTNKQLDQLIAAVKDYQQRYNKQVADAAGPPVKAIADEVKAVRKKMLAGGDMPTAMDEKIKKIQDDIVAKRNQAEFDTVKGLAGEVRKIFTADQIKTAESLSKKFWTSGPGGKDAPKIDYLNFYVLEVLIVYPRTLPLLEDMKAARSSESAGNTRVREAQR